MVARILGKLLHMVGILPTDKVTEVQRTDLVGEFVGHTGPKTRRKVRRRACLIASLLIYLEHAVFMNAISSTSRSKKQRVEFFLSTKPID